MVCIFVVFFQAEDGIRDGRVTGVQTCALPICPYLDGGTGVRREDRHLRVVRAIPEVVELDGGRDPRGPALVIEDGGHVPPAGEEAGPGRQQERSATQAQRNTYH